jgi:hypothetical protein
MASKVVSFSLSILLAFPVVAGAVSEKDFEVRTTRDADGGTTYWALTHRGPEPDFHRRNSFILEL